jgi:hypothetical protein
MVNQERIQEEYEEWLHTHAGENEIVVKKCKAFSDECKLQFFMYKMGFSNRQYAKKLMNQYNGESRNGNSNS